MHVRRRGCGARGQPVVRVRSGQPRFYMAFAHSLLLLCLLALARGDVYTFDLTHTLTMDPQGGRQRSGGAFVLFDVVSGPPVPCRTGPVVRTK